MHIELADDPTAFVSRDWTALVRADPTGTFFHTPAYLKLWWEEFGTGSLLLAFAMEGREPIGACAFEVVERKLTFLGGLDVTDYMGPVARPGRERAVAKELVAAVARTPGWDGADLRGVAVDSPWFEALREAMESSGLLAERSVGSVALVLELPGSYEGYLAALPARLRHEIRRKARRMEGEGEGPRLRSATPDSAAEDLDRFIDLHRASPEPKGRFMRPGMEMFFRRLAEAFLPRGALHLTYLEVEGRRAAGAIGFTFGNTFSLYNSAFDRDLAHLSPGMVLVADLIERAIQAGCGRFDMLTGDLAYKHRFGPAPRPIGRLVAHQP